MERTEWSYFQCPLRSNEKRVPGQVVLTCLWPPFGRVLIAPGDGWVLVQGEHASDLLVWVREDLLSV